MKKILPLLAAMLFAAFSSAGYTAGGPMNQDLTTLSPGAEKAVAAGKAGDAAAFVKESEAVLAQAKEFAASAASQRIVKHMKNAVIHGQGGKLTEGVAEVEEAMTDMKMGGVPKFGGGS
jgi:Small metal-binding protein